MAAAAGPVATVLGTHRPVGAQPRGSVTPANLELVTLTEDRAVFTWYTGYEGSDDGLARMEPAPGDAEIAWGTHPDRLDQVAGGRATDTPYHVVEIDGLEPGREYWYEARSGGVAVPPTVLALVGGNAVSTDDGPPPETGPYRFTTPQPPPGDFLFSIILCNDMHIGETTAGLVGALPGIEGISQLPGLDPYPEIMLAALVADAERLGASYLLAAGDITAEAVPVDVAKAKELLDRFGDRQSDWYAARGNHDREHDGPEWATCSIGPHGGHDCFRDDFYPDGEPTWFSEDLHGLRVIGLDTYDTAGTGGGAGLMTAEQLDWFRRELASDPGRPTVVFGHHPLTVTGSPYPVTDGSLLDTDQAASVVAEYASTPGVFLHHAGHTHRNKRSALPEAPQVVHQEVAAVKEYPGGFTLMRVHTGGYALNFHKSSGEDALAWNERSRMQIGGTWPQFSLGTNVADRNHVVELDLSSVSAPPAAVAPASTVPGVASTTEVSPPSGGGSAIVPVAAGAAAVTAVAAGAVAWHRRGADADAEEPVLHDSDV